MNPSLLLIFLTIMIPSLKTCLSFTTTFTKTRQRSFTLTYTKQAFATRVTRATTRRRYRHPKTILPSSSSGSDIETESDTTSTTATTQYTINDQVCSPTDESDLCKIVQKHCRTQRSYDENRPLAAHTKAAFDSICNYIDSYTVNDNDDNDNDNNIKKIILDSGCGTGRSTLLLGEMYPDHIVIGIDRSFIRLNKNSLSNEIGNDINIEMENDSKSDSDSNSSSSSSSSSNSSSKGPFQAISSNVLLVRAELTDFWRLCGTRTLTHEHTHTVDSATSTSTTTSKKWDITHHYILYPNPYPKKNRIKKRFYAHPSFPFILSLGAGQIVVRSNWEGYLKEFANSVLYANDYYEEQQQQQQQQGVGDRNINDDQVETNIALAYYENAKKGPHERIDKTVAYTNFEKKYDNVGEKTYELIL